MAHSQIPTLADLVASIPPADEDAATQARARLDSLTKPPGSLGQIEDLLVRLAASTGQCCPTLDRRAVVLAAADHGVAAEGVSAYPQAVTAQMVQNYLAGGAAINALAQAAGADLVVIDAGLVVPVPEHPALRRLGIRHGSGNIAREPAMTVEEAQHAVEAGIAIVEDMWKVGINLIALGEMGIANTTPAAALTSAFTGASPSETVGRGTGIDDARLAHKREVVAQALNRTENREPRTENREPRTQHSALTLLSELGGLEIAVLAGVTLAAAAHRVPVLLDGYITTSAALVAAALAPSVTAHLFAAHCSAEPGHALALAHLGLTAAHGAGPLLQLGLGLGEGSGAALAMPLLVSAAQLMREMATFGEAGVDGSA